MQKQTSLVKVIMVAFIDGFIAKSLDHTETVRGSVVQNKK